MTKLRNYITNNKFNEIKNSFNKRKCKKSEGLTNFN